MKYEIAEWLRGLEGITNVEPIQLCVDGKLFEGAGYLQNDKYYYYIVGDLPKPHGTFKEVCFRLRGTCDWWVCDHWSDITSLESHMKVHHPFGPNWTITPWLGEVSIEDFMEKKYERNYASIEIYVTQERMRSNDQACQVATP